MTEIHGFTTPQFEGVRAAFAANFANGSDIGASVAVTLERRTGRRSLGRPCRCGADQALGKGHAGQRLFDHQDHVRADGAAARRPRRTGFQRAGCPLLAGVRGERQGRCHGRPADVAQRRPVGLEGAAGEGRRLRLGEGDGAARGAGALLDARHQARLPRHDAGLPGRRSRPPHHRAEPRHRLPHRNRRAAGRRFPSSACPPARTPAWPSWCRRRGAPRSTPISPPN